MASVLLVDDEPAIRRMLSIMVRSLGLETIPAEDAENALGLLEEDVPDLIITDVRLPGLSGDELARRVKSEPRLSSVPIVLISAYQEPRGHVADAFLPKPFDLDALSRLVNRYLPGERNGDSESPRS